MKKGLIMGLFCIMIFCMAGCGSSDSGETKQQEVKGTGLKSVDSIWEVNLCRMKDGILYNNPDGSYLGYFDYGTGAYLPFCAKANCRHDNQKCQAVRLHKQIVVMGADEESVYYLFQDDNGNNTFYRCDRTGENETRIGEFPHFAEGWGANQAIVRDKTLIMATNDDQWDEKTNEWKAATSGIFQYDLKTGKAEALCEEKQYQVFGDGYQVLGIHDNDLIYAEETTEKKEIWKMDLDSREKTKLLEGWYGSLLWLADGAVIRTIEEDGLKPLVVYDLESGKETKPEGLDGINQVLWEKEFKLAYYGEGYKKDFRYKIYQCDENGESHLIRQGEEENLFYPKYQEGDLLIGQAGENWDLAYMKKEDFLAGKNNWTVIEE